MSWFPAFIKPYRDLIPAQARIVYSLVYSFCHFILQRKQKLILFKWCTKNVHINILYFSMRCILCFDQHAGFFQVTLFFINSVNAIQQSAGQFIDMLTIFLSLFSLLKYIPPPHMLYCFTFPTFYCLCLLVLNTGV